MMNMPKKTIFLLVGVLLAGLFTPCYGDEAMEAKIEELLGKMTFREKIQMLSGDESRFNGEGVERLGIPKLKMADGPVGVRVGEATALPVSVNLAASWDTDLARRYGVVLAQETKAKGKHVILGPCICIHRFPLSGRNFENFGEDPYLTSRITVPYIEGVQGEHVVATAKHYAANDQEWERHNVDILVDERALREIHLPAFEVAVKEADVYAVMNAYNIVNGWHASENKHLLVEILKEEWGFDGIVMSDWGSVYSAVEAANHGLDLEMPNGKWFGKKLVDAIKADKVSKATIDDKVRRNLRVRFKAGVFENPDPKEDDSVIRSEAHRKFALEAAAKSMILLKNDTALPLDKSKLKKIAVIGPNAKVARTGGGGSSTVNPWRVVTPFDGIAKLAGSDVEVGFAQGIEIGLGGYEPIPPMCLQTGTGEKGLQGEYYNKTEPRGRPDLVRVDPQINFSYKSGSPAEGIGRDNFSIRWTGVLIPRKSGMHTLGLASDDGSMLYLEDTLAIDNGGAHGQMLKTCRKELVAGKAYPIRLEFTEISGGASMKFLWKEPGVMDSEAILQQAVALAAESDVAIVCVGNTHRRESEGSDVPSFEMEGDQDKLVKAIAAVNPNTVVVLSGGTPIYLGAWLDEVDGLIAAMYPGQEGGEALAQILFGEVNPSAKLPFSYIQNKSETYAFDGYMDESLKMPYKEGVFVGYRYYDKQDIKPLFEFGYGLSYTTFEYSNLNIEKSGELEYTVTATVKNTGDRAGDEIVQLYVDPPKSKVDRPVKELKGFAKVALDPGESKTVQMKLDPRSFQYYDVEAKDWAADSGVYQVLLGASSRDIRLRETVELP